MNFKKYSSFIVVILFFIIVGFFSYNYERLDIKKKELNLSDIKYVKISGKMIKVDLAITSEAQGRGLSGQKSLKEDEGMLFIFSKPNKNYFWMKEMNFPIDMIWIDDNFKVIYIKKDALPSSYPEFFGPGVDNRYVFEVVGSFSEKNNLKVGDVVEFLR
jgi:hypothetical protein